LESKFIKEDENEFLLTAVDFLHYHFITTYHSSTDAGYEKIAIAQQDGE